MTEKKCQSKDPKKCRFHSVQHGQTSSFDSSEEMFAMIDAAAKKRQAHRDRGIHWSKADNPRLSMLAKKRAYRVQDKTIDVTYGSSGGSVVLRSVDEGAKALFLHGNCAIFAWSMHVKTGLPFAVFTAKTSTNENWQGHVGLLTDSGQILDIMGTRSPKDVANNFRNLEGNYTVMNAEEFKDNFVPKHVRKNPVKLFHELEQLILEDFAEHVLSENKIPLTPFHLK